MLVWVVAPEGQLDATKVARYGGAEVGVVVMRWVASGQ
jgi:hypothetical protein